ncbi:MAG: MFS transporter [Rhodococcus sp. (in: high G+C Gram-positive bacteria)]
MGSAHAYVIWSVGVVAYTIAVFQRTSFGVSGLDAAQRFQVDPATLSLFVAVQVVVYASMQIPAGLLQDRFGTRVLVCAGAVIMASGQATLALTNSLPIAVAGRLLVGAGDSLTLIAVLNLVALWFPSRRGALFYQLTGMIGQLGQVLSAVPLAWLLRQHGWTHAYIAAAAVSVLVAVLSASVIKDAPNGAAREQEGPEKLAVGARLRSVATNPGTIAGFFAHMGTMFSLTTFVLLWGVPYLSEAQGTSHTFIATALSMSVAVSIVGGFLFGMVSGRRPHLRERMVMSIICANMLVWSVVLSLSDVAPLWLLLILVATMSLGAPGSLIGFDLARTANAPHVLGTAQGVVNTGGYVATLIATAGIGFVLSSADGYDQDSFRMAWTVQYPIWIVSIVGMIMAARRAKALGR